MVFRSSTVLPVCGCLLITFLLFLLYNYREAWHGNNVKVAVVQTTDVQRTPPPGEIAHHTFVHPKLPELPMQYIPPPMANVSVMGRPFNVDPKLLTSLGIPFTEFSSMDPDSIGNFVFVTGSSFNHFKESIDGIGGVQKHFPDYKIYYYDLGLEPEQVVEVNTFCGVIYRKFSFDRYPEHVKQLATYAFKALIVQEMLLEHESVFWMDASIRPTRNFTSLYPQLLQSGGFLQIKNTGFYNFAVTNKTMYEYLPTSVSRQKHTYQGEANCLYIRRTKSAYWGIVYWWVMCALDRNCMAPIGAKVECVFDKGGDLTVDMNCHRFDQSALGILASNMHGYDYNMYISRSQVLKILRKVTDMYEVQRCNVKTP